MSQAIDNFFENNIFTFKSHGCDCVEDVTHVIPGMPPATTYKFQALPNNPLFFAYRAKTGLARIAQNGTSEEDNILGSLIALPTKKQKDFYAFFQRNGFLFPVSMDKYESIDSALLYGFILRIRATVELMTAANEIHKDYNKIVNLTLQLMLGEQLTINMDSLPAPYTTCRHSFADTLDKSAGMTLSKERRQESFNKDTYSVTDTIVLPSYEFNVNEYNDIISGSTASSNLYKQIVELYLSYNGTETERKTIDFLFHLQHDYAQIQSIDPVNGLILSKSVDLSKMNDKMKAAAIEISHHVLGEEINANLNGIFPQYDELTMAPSWKIDSLLSAVYFSIFYLKPDLELYRQCANPRCQKYFLVRTTSTRKKFCSTECCNRVTQDKYRKKRREKSEE